jgi:signal peptidase I
LGLENSEVGGVNPSPEIPPPPTVSERPKKPVNWARTLREYGTLALIAVIMATLIRAFVGLAFYIPSESMEPTLMVNDRILVSRLTYRFREPKRSDIIVFQNPDYQGKETPLVLKPFEALFQLVGARQPKDKHFVKRIIGLPGETVEIKDGSVWINDERLDEPWLPKGVATYWDEGAGKKLTIPEDQYWVMGDNRGKSSDSRYFGGGQTHFIKKSAIIGPAVLRVWPFSRFGHP